MIPKNLFHTYRSYDESDLHPELRNNREAMVAENPTWTQYFFTDDEAMDFVRTYYPGRVFNAYNRIAPEYGVMRADFLRYLLVYHYGGAYFDLKSGATRPLDEILIPSDEYIITRLKHVKSRSHFEKELLTVGEIENWHIIARAGHPFLEAAIEEVTRGIENYRPHNSYSGKIGVIKITGPHALTRAVQPLIDAGNTQYRQLNKENSDLVYTRLSYRTRHVELHKNHYKSVRVVHVLPKTDDNFLGKVIWKAQERIYYFRNGFRDFKRAISGWKNRYLP